MVDLKILCICLIFCVMYVPQTKSNEIYDTVKHGIEKVGHTIHCYSHKLKNVVYEHEHQPGQNPCSETSTTPRTFYSNPENAEVEEFKRR